MFKKIKELFKVLPCPYCYDTPRLNAVGSLKNLLIYQCPTCKIHTVRYDEARATARGAARIWNKNVKKIHNTLR